MRLGREGGDPIPGSNEAFGIDDVTAFLANAKTVDISRCWHSRGGKEFPRVPIVGPTIGRYQPVLLLVLDPSSAFGCSCRIMVEERIRIRGVNYEPFADPKDGRVTIQEWHEHRWDPKRQTRDHYLIPELQGLTSFPDVLRWAGEAWGLRIVGMDKLPRSLLEG